MIDGKCSGRMESHFLFQEPSLTITNGDPRATFQFSYFTEFLANTSSVKFDAQLHLGCGGTHHAALAGSEALVRVLPGESYVRSCLGSVGL